MAGSSRRSSARKKITTAGGAIDSSEDSSGRNLRSNSSPQSHRGTDRSLIRILNVNIKTLLGLGILLSSIAVFLIYQLVSTHDEPEMPRVITPFPAPKLMDLLMVNVPSFAI